MQRKMAEIDDKMSWSNQEMLTEAQSDYIIVAGSLCLLILSFFVGFTHFIRRCIQTMHLVRSSRTDAKPNNEKDDKENSAEEPI